MRTNNYYIVRRFIYGFETKLVIYIIIMPCQERSVIVETYVYYCVLGYYELG